MAQPIHFDPNGALGGTIGTDLTAPQALELGLSLAPAGKAALGWSGGDGAAMLSRALGAGLCSGGATVLAHDGCCPASAAWLGEYYGLPLSLFVEQVGPRAYLRSFGPDSLPKAPTGAAHSVTADRVGHWEPICGVNTTWSADVSRRLGGAEAGVPLLVSIPGDSRWDSVAADTLERLGCRVLRREAPGVPSFSADRGGFWLLGVDELGRAADPARLLALICRLELEEGRPVAVEGGAPAVIDAMGKTLGALVLRTGRDRNVREISAASPWLRCALFAAAYLARTMIRRRITLAELVDALPPFARQRIQVPLRRDPDRVLNDFTSRFRRAEPAGEGIRLNTADGWIYVAPKANARALLLQADADTAELAEELCGFYREELSRLDQTEPSVRSRRTK